MVTIAACSTLPQPAIRLSCTAGPHIEEGNSNFRGVDSPRCRRADRGHRQRHDDGRLRDAARAFDRVMHELLEIRPVFPGRSSQPLERVRQAGSDGQVLPRRHDHHRLRRARCGRCGRGGGSTAPELASARYAVCGAGLTRRSLHPQTPAADDPDLARGPHAHVRRDPVRAGRTGRAGRAELRAGGGRARVSACASIPAWTRNKSRNSGRYTASINPRSNATS